MHIRIGENGQAQERGLRELSGIAVGQDLEGLVRSDAHAERIAPFQSSSFTTGRRNLASRRAASLACSRSCSRSRKDDGRRQMAPIAAPTR